MLVFFESNHVSLVILIFFHGIGLRKILFVALSKTAFSKSQRYQAFKAWSTFSERN